MDKAPNTTQPTHRPATLTPVPERLQAIRYYNAVLSVASKKLYHCVEKAVEWSFVAHKTSDEVKQVYKDCKKEGEQFQPRLEAATVDIAADSLFSESEFAYFNEISPTLTKQLRQETESYLKGIRRF